MATPSVGLVKFDTGVDTTGLRRDMKRAGTELQAGAKVAQTGFSRALNRGAVGGGGMGGMGGGGQFASKLGNFGAGKLGMGGIGSVASALGPIGLGVTALVLGAVAAGKAIEEAGAEAKDRLASGKYGGWSKEGLAGANMGGTAMKDIKGFGSGLWDKAQSAWGRLLFEGGVSGRMYAGQSEADARATILKEQEDDAKEKGRLEAEAKKIRKQMSGATSLAPVAEYSSAAGYSMVAESQWAQRRTQMTSVMAARLAEISKKLGEDGLSPAEGVA